MFIYQLVYVGVNNEDSHVGPDPTLQMAY
jgi:hypothetical protein